MLKARNSGRITLDRELNDDELEELFSWLDGIPLSRKKKNLTRDFSDGILVAEIVKFYFPRIVEIHNYSAVNSRSQKINNWTTLNRKVLPKLDSCADNEIMNKMVDCTPGVIECFLYKLRRKIEYRIMKNKTKPNNAVKLRPLNLSKSEANTVIVESKSQHDRHDPSFDLIDQITEENYKSAIGLDQLDLSPLDVRTRLILEEKEQALLASQETVQILQVKIRRLEHLLRLKDLRIQEFESGQK